MRRVGQALPATVIPAPHVPSSSRSTSRGAPRASRRSARQDRGLFAEARPHTSAGGHSRRSRASTSAVVSPAGLRWNAHQRVAPPPADTAARHTPPSAERPSCRACPARARQCRHERGSDDSSRRCSGAAERTGPHPTGRRSWRRCRRPRTDTDRSSDRRPGAGRPAGPPSSGRRRSVSSCSYRSGVTEMPHQGPKSHRRVSSAGARPSCWNCTWKTSVTATTPRSAIEREPRGRRRCVAALRRLPRPLICGSVAPGAAPAAAASSAHARKSPDASSAGSRPTAALRYPAELVKAVIAPASRAGTHTQSSSLAPASLRSSGTNRYRYAASTAYAMTYPAASSPACWPARHSTSGSSTERGTRPHRGQPQIHQVDDHESDEYVGGGDDEQEEVPRHLDRFGRAAQHVGPLGGVDRVAPAPLERVDAEAEARTPRTARSRRGRRGPTR